MAGLSAFDIIGPVMIGPSSSHTAGAVRMARMAREITGSNIVEAEIYLHGSFARTYRGHGTDRALIAGLLGFSTDDIRIKDSFKIAREIGLTFNFVEVDLGDYHPNTARLVLKDLKGEITEVIACSVGGGKIRVMEINGYPVDLSGEYHTLITWHEDTPGVIAAISEILERFHLNIAFMKVFRENRGELATAVIQLDETVDNLVDAVEQIKEIHKAKLIKPVE